MNWIEKECKYANLGDARLNNRLNKILLQKYNNPNGSIPENSRGTDEMKATYRFLNNPYFKESDILESHIKNTKERIKKENIVLAVQDTTSIDYSKLTETKGLGILETKTSKGVMLHSTLAVTPDRRTLGLISQKMWSRKTKEEKGDKRRDQDIPIQEKESYRWIESLNETNKVQKESKETKIVNIGDRETDIYEYLHRADKLNQSVLFRAHYNRNISESEERMINYIEGKEVSGTFTLEISKSKKSEKRIAELSVRFSECTLTPPKKNYNSDELQDVKVNVILAKEEVYNENVEPISWILVTNTEVKNFEEALERINWYTCRWQIETFHKILKSGCNVKTRFREVERIKKNIALDSIISWKILNLTMAERNNEKTICTEVFTEEEWKVLYLFEHKTKELPSEIPDLKSMKRYLAKLGGFLGRKGDGEPGITVIWRGMKKLSTLVEAWSLFG